MACAAQHSTLNFFVVTAATAAVQHREGCPVDGTSLAMGLAAAALPTLPDHIEPALHLNHRKFFHSIAVVAGLAYAVRQVYVWEAEGEWERLARALLLAGGAAYLGHFALDALSAKSLPLI